MFLHFISSKRCYFAVSIPQSLIKREISFLALISPVLLFEIYKSDLLEGIQESHSLLGDFLVTIHII